MADYHQQPTKDNPLVSLVVDPGEGRDCDERQQQNRHAHQEQEVTVVAEAISSDTNDTTGLCSMKRTARIRCRMPLKKVKFLSSLESKPSPDCTLDICGPRNCLDPVPYSVRLKNEVETQIGLYNGILDYQNLHGKSPFDDINSMSQFFIEWFQVDEPLESIISVIDDLRITCYSNAVAVNNDLEKEAFLLAQRIWNSGCDKSVNVASGDGAASSNLMSLQMKGEKAQGGGRRVVAFNGKGKKKVSKNSSEDEDNFTESESANKPVHHDKSIQEFVEVHDDIMKTADGGNYKYEDNISLKLLQFLAAYVEEIGADPLESDTLMEDFIENHVPTDISVSKCSNILLSVKKRYKQLKLAGKIGDRHSIPVEKRKLMKLADDIWCEDMRFAFPETQYLRKDHSNDAKNPGIPDRSQDSSFSVEILEAMLFYREAMLVNPIENETAMHDVFISVNIGMTRKECNELLANIRVVYENAKAAGLLKGDNSIHESEMQILRLADCLWGDKNQTANDLFPYTTGIRVVYDAKPLSVVYPEQVGQQPPIGSAGKGKQCQGGCNREVPFNRKGKKVDESNSEDSAVAESVDKPMHHNSILLIDLCNDTMPITDGGEYEDEDSIRLELLQSLADYVDEMGVDPLVSDICTEEFIKSHVQTDTSVSNCKRVLLRVKQKYMQLKSTGKIRDPDSIPAEERELMQLANNIWCDEMEILNHQEDEAEEDSEDPTQQSIRNSINKQQEQ